MVDHKDWLQQQLQRSEPYLQDDGFTNAVVRRLAEQPAPQPAYIPTPFNHFLLAAGVTAVGSVIAMLGVSQVDLTTWQTLSHSAASAAEHPAKLLTLLAAGWFSALLISGVALLKVR